MEIWKDIKGYVGFYQVSNLGNVRRLKRWIGNQHVSKYISEIKVINYYLDKYGYKRVCLSMQGKNKHMRIHRLVAEAFIPNTYNLPEVNHKDENKNNNCADNLEWCNHQYNSSYGTRGKRISVSQHLNGTSNRAVLQFDKNNNYITEYKSLTDAANAVNVSVPSICKCCSGYKKFTAGYIWKYKDAKQKAQKQGRAVRASGWKGK